MSRRAALLAASCTALLLAGCGDDDGTTTRGSTGTTPTTTGTGTTSTTPGTGTTTGSTSGSAAGPPAASPAQVAALPAGLVPAAPAGDADDARLVDELRARFGRAPAALRRAGSARFRIDLTLSSGPIAGSGSADFRTGASRNGLSLGSGAGGSTIDQYNDGRTSFTRTGDAPWTREVSIIPSAPGNSVGLFARQLRVGRAGAETSVAGVRCRWAAGVVPLRELIEGGGAADAPQVQSLLRVAKQDAAYPIGACVSAEGLIAELRYDIAFDRDLGLPGSAGRERFGGRIRFSDFGDAPTVRRPADLPAG
ncbi:hypothetical protein [Patulibacter sp.]|uniref:hypothetical protein n=1 Tax=Patulibacter sp. TaxID=1912859 RepID=UPI002726A684|nr:hypothetical protein [Patulibacter sp.]MDO9409594.1 hypothetical protein [Patulibacter sp.]